MPVPQSIGVLTNRHAPSYIRMAAKVRKRYPQLLDLRHQIDLKSHEAELSTTPDSPAKRLLSAYLSDPDKNENDLKEALYRDPTAGGRYQYSQLNSNPRDEEAFHDILKLRNKYPNSYLPRSWLQTNLESHLNAASSATAPMIVRDSLEKAQQLYQEEVNARVSKFRRPKGTIGPTKHGLGYGFGDSTLGGRRGRGGYGSRGARLRPPANVMAAIRNHNARMTQATGGIPIGALPPAPAAGAGRGGVGRGGVHLQPGQPQPAQPAQPAQPGGVGRGAVPLQPGQPAQQAQAAQPVPSSTSAASSSSPNSSNTSISESSASNAEGVTLLGAGDGAAVASPFPPLSEDDDVFVY